MVNHHWRMRKKEKIRVRVRVCGAEKVIEVWLYIYTCMGVHECIGDACKGHTCVTRGNKGSIIFEEVVIGC